MARVLASVPALSVVLAALAASAASPCIVKEMVAVVAVVIGVATLMDVVLRAVESADVSELVRAAVALASAARLAPPRAGRAPAPDDLRRQDALRRRREVRLPAGA